MEENVIQINGVITINVDVSVKKRHVCEKDYVWNPATWNCENGKYLASVMDDSMISCNEIINVMETNFMKKIKLAKHRILIFSYIPIFLFLLINIAL